jgi:poly(A) polymerase Pap1
MERLWPLPPVVARVESGEVSGRMLGGGSVIGRCVLRICELFDEGSFIIHCQFVHVLCRDGWRWSEIFGSVLI